METSAVKIIVSLMIAALWSFLPNVLAEGDDAQWTYEGEHVPENWGDLSPDYIQCRVGLNQSPVDIRDALEADLPTLALVCV
jgi:carbonic anhydrase